MKKHLHYVICTLLFAAVLLNYGCSSSVQTRFYVLYPIKDKVQQQVVNTDTCPIVGIGPIRLPKYVDRPQIVSSGGDHELLLSDEAHWAEPLSYNFPSVVALNLSSLTCTKDVVVFPWRSGMPINYRVDIEVLRLDGKPGGNVYMDARWDVTKTSSPPEAWRTSTFVIPTENSGYDGFVKAQSKAVGALSVEIAKAIQSLESRKQP
jgi:uncharacterized protein